MSDPTLTERQTQILDVIRRAVRQRGIPPSIREIGASIGLASSSTVHNHLRQLEEKGYIRRDPARPRCIELVNDPLEAMQATAPDEEEEKRVGLYPVLESLHAIEAGTDPMRVPLPRDLVGGDDGFLFQVEGDSMRDAGILHGDLVIARRRDEAEDGDIVVALVNQDITVKRYFGGSGHTRLESDNRRMKPIYVRDARVIGKVVGLIRRIY
jgi:repressor LexA